MSEKYLLNNLTKEEHIFTIIINYTGNFTASISTNFKLKIIYRPTVTRRTSRAFLIPYLLSCISWASPSRLFPATRTWWCCYSGVRSRLWWRRGFRTREAVPNRAGSARFCDSSGVKLHPAPNYGGFVQRRVARLRILWILTIVYSRVRSRHTPSPQKGRRWYDPDWTLSFSETMEQTAFYPFAYLQR